MNPKRRGIFKLLFLAVTGRMGIAQDFTSPSTYTAPLVLANSKSFLTIKLDDFSEKEALIVEYQGERLTFSVKEIMDELRAVTEVHKK